jgi:hypothetical protein
MGAGMKSRETFRTFLFRCKHINVTALGILGLLVLAARLSRLGCNDLAQMRCGEARLQDKGVIEEVG